MLSHIKQSRVLINFKNLTGEVWTSEVGPNELVESLKDQIYEKTGFPADQQRLIFRGKTLDDQRTLSDSGVLSGSTIHIVRPLRDLINLNFKTLTGEAWTSEVGPNELVESLKDRIYGKTGFPAGQQRLIFQGKTLDDQRTLSDSGVLSGSTIHIVRPLRVLINFKTFAGEAWTSQVGPNELVESLKDQIYEKTGIPTNQQVIIFGGKTLDGRRTLSDSGVLSGSTIYIKVEEISVQVYTCEMVKIPLNSVQTAGDIKTRVKGQISIEIPDDAIVMMADMLFNDHDNIVDLVTRESIVYIASAPSVIVTRPNELDWLIEINENDTVANVKSRIFDKSGVAIDYQLLKYGETELEDKRALSQYGIEIASNLEIVYSCDKASEICHDGMGLFIMRLNADSRLTTIEGRSIQLLWNSAYTVENFKQRLRAEISDVPRNAVVMLLGQRLEDHRKISDYKILPGHHIYFASALSVFVNNNLLLEIKKNDTLEDVMTKIYVKSGMVIDYQFLTHNGDELEQFVDKHTLSDLGIQAGSFLRLKTRNGNMFGYHANNLICMELGRDSKFSVKIDSEPIKFSYYSTETVDDTKKRLRDSLTSIPDNAVLIVRDQILEGHRKLADYKILPGRVVYVAPKLSQWIIVSSNSGSSIQEVEQNDTVGDVKWRFRGLQIPPEQQRLFYNGKRLEDKYTLLHYGIRRGALLFHCLLLRAGGISNILSMILDRKNVTLKMVSGSTIKIPWKPEDTTEDIKRRVEDKNPRLLSRDAVLMVGNQELQDDRKLSDYNIRPGHVIKVVDKAT